MTNSNRKGKTGERDLAEKLRAYGYEARRGVQYSGLTGAADVVGLPGIHIEVKRYKTITDSQLQEALRQAIRDARAEEVPAVFYREDRKKWRVYMLAVDLVCMAVSSPWLDFLPPAHKCRVTMTLADFMEVYKNWEEAKQ